MTISQMKSAIIFVYLISLLTIETGSIQKPCEEIKGSDDENQRKCDSNGEWNPHVAALILARGGSKGIKLKNLATVGGVTLLRRALDAIVESDVFDSIWVSTDHDLISEEAKKGGAQVHRRSEESATDTATSIFAVQEFLRHHEEVHILALIQCTSPFIKPIYLQQAYASISNKTKCVFSVSRSHKLRWKEDSSGIIPLNFNPSRRPSRFDWKGELIENGMFYFAYADLLSKGNFQDCSCAFVEISSRDSLEVDDNFDLQVANIMHNVSFT